MQCAMHRHIAHACVPKMLLCVYVEHALIRQLFVILNGIILSIFRIAIDCFSIKLYYHTCECIENWRIECSDEFTCDISN